MLDKLLAIADYPGAAARAESAARAGRPDGHRPGRLPRQGRHRTERQLAKRGGLHGGWESAIVRVHSDGKVTTVRRQPLARQGHEITFCRSPPTGSGLPIDDIRLVEGDTDRIPFGNGTWGARSISVGGTAIYRAATRSRQGPAHRRAGRSNAPMRCRLCRRRVQRARHRTGRSLRGGRRHRLSRRDAARTARSSPGSKSPSSTIRPTPTIRRRCIWRWSIVDRDTGTVTLRDLYAVDDCGVVINPMIVEGQVHGGLAQGIGQALMEQIVYDRDRQLLTGAFMDYGMPRAGDLPAFRPPSSRRRRRAIRSASRARAKAARSARPRPSATR